MPLGLYSGGEQKANIQFPERPEYQKSDSRNQFHILRGLSRPSFASRALLSPLVDDSTYIQILSPRPLNY